MIKKVYRDNLGKVINIGDWDYIITSDEHGNEMVNNPLPEDYSVSEEEIYFLDDGGLAVLNL